MRIIDADELMEHVWRDRLDSRELIAKMIENAPTVKEIPTSIPLDIFERLLSLEKDSVHPIEKTIKALEQESKSKWIPVSKNPPEEDGWYQCTVIVNALPWTMELFYKNGKWLDNRRIDMFNTYDMYGYGCTNEKHKLSYQELISEFDWTEKVVAWMPLSKPYKAEN